MPELIGEQRDQKQHIAHVRYWEAAYKAPASGPHFWGHGVVANLLGEYADLLERLAERDRHPLATPEMVECVSAVQAFGAFVQKLERLASDGADLRDRYDLADERSAIHGRLRRASQAIDAGRAARQEGQNDV